METKKTKIICTIGPASWDPGVIRSMIEEGMDVARVNGAFADTDELDKVAALVRAVSDDVALMVDVKGSDIRLNKFPEKIQIEPGGYIVLGSSQEDYIYPINYPSLFQYIYPGQRVIIGDGEAELIVREVKDGKMNCEVIFGEFIGPGKALSVPGCEYAREVLTQKDKENLRHAINTGWDLVSASFIRNAESARAINEFIGDSQIKLIAKIENEEGVKNIEEILKEVSGVMVARGGLGVELGLHKIAFVQQKLIKRLNEAGLPVITATQMLDSMINNPSPTRAEATDVTCAVLQGTDAVMLSGESAIGKYPVESVKFLVKIAKEAEKPILPGINKSRAEAPLTTDAISKAAAEVSMSMGEDLDAVIVVSKSGTTARLLARHNIRQPIFVFTSTDTYKRGLKMTKGITRSFVFEGMEQKDCRFDRDCGIKTILGVALKERVVEKGFTILFLGKTPIGIGKSEYFPNLFEIVKI